MGILNKSRETIADGVEGRSRGLSAGDLIIPALSIVIFGILSVAVLIPMLITGQDSVLNIRAELQDISDQQDELDKKLLALSPYIQSEAEIKVDLEAATTVVPDDLDISDFSYYVDQVAKENNLRLDSLSASNSSVQSYEGNINKVNGPVTYVGTYSDIVNFLDLIQVRSPYLIESSNISLSLESTAEEVESTELLNSSWEVSILLSGFFIPSSTENYIPNPYLPFFDYSKNEEYVTVFRNKLDLIENANNDQLDLPEQNSSDANDGSGNENSNSSENNGTDEFDIDEGN